MNNRKDTCGTSYLNGYQEEQERRDGGAEEIDCLNCMNRDGWRQHANSIVWLGMLYIAS